MSKQLEQDLISVIVPVYNTEAYMHQALKSIQDQDYKNLQVIMIDDGSKDKSGDIAEEFAKSDPRFEIIHQENKGLSAVDNLGLKLARGKYITFVDGDDWIDSDFISFLYEKIKSDDFDFVCCTCIDHFVDTGEKVECTKGKDAVFGNEEAVHDLLTDHTFLHEALMQKLYKKEVFDGYHLIEGRWYQDASTCFNILPKCKKMAYYDVCKYHYRVRSGSITHSGYTPHSIDQVLMYTENYDLVVKTWPKQEKYMSHYVVSDSMANYIKMVLEDKEDQYPEDKKFYFENFKKYKPVLAMQKSKIALYVLWKRANQSPEGLRNLILKLKKYLGPAVNANI